MSFVIVDDPVCSGVDLASGPDRTALHIRAWISTRSELEELIAKLSGHLNDFAQEEKHDNPTAEPVRPGFTPGIPYGCTGGHTKLKGEATWRDTYQGSGE